MVWRHSACGGSVRHHAVAGEGMRGRLPRICQVFAYVHDAVYRWNAALHASCEDKVADREGRAPRHVRSAILCEDSVAVWRGCAPGEDDSVCIWRAAVQRRADVHAMRHGQDGERNRGFFLLDLPLQLYFLCRSSWSAQRMGLVVLPGDGVRIWSHNAQPNRASAQQPREEDCDEAYQNPGVMINFMMDEVLW